MTLFGPEPGEAAVAKTPTRPRWSAITAGRCDICVFVATRDLLHRIQPARWRRLEGELDRRYCYEHARPIRAADDAEHERKGAA